MQAKLCILHSVAFLKRKMGGMPLSVSSLCRSLGETGATVYLVSQDWETLGDTNYIPDQKYVNLHLVKAIHSNSMRFIYSRSYYDMLIKLCRNKAIQIIHDHGLWLLSNHAAARASHRLKIPLIIQPRGSLEPWALSHKACKKNIVWRIYQRQNLERASLLIATSKQEAESIRKIGLRQPVAIIPNGINLPEMKEYPHVKRTKRSALFLSRIHPKKGLMNLIIAWERVRPEGWQVIIAGPDEENHQRELRRIIAVKKLADDFQFVGPVEGFAKEELYRRADFFVLPTLSENFGSVVAEALGYGVPVITTKGAPWEGLLSHKCGWWVDVGVEPLAKAIYEATKLSDEERRKMGARGRSFVKKDFSWSQVANQTLAVYDWLLGMREKPTNVTLD